MPNSFRTLAAFDRALDLVVEVYEVTRSSPREETYGLTSQMRRAAISVVSQIAEGYGRLTPGELRQFLSQARGSLFEIDAQCIAAHRLGILSDSDRERLDLARRRVGKPLAGLIRFVRSQRA